MNTDIIIRLLQNSGFHILGTDSTYLYLEDPSCILRSFETFIEYAWIVIVCITGVLLFGWAISMIRGAKNDIFTNLRNLIIMFGTLSAAVPIVNMIWGDDLFARGCRTIRVSIAELNEIIEMQDSKLAEYDQFNFYENFDIYDSGAVPYAEAPLATPDLPVDLETVSVSDDVNTAPIAVSELSQEFGARQTEPSELTEPIAHNVPLTNARRAGAHAMGNDVVYTNANGTQYRKTGGTRAWRNNNPGNIRYSQFSRRAGAIGQAGGFAVFPDEQTGMRAICALLKSDGYRNLTISQAIFKYAPPHENNTENYKATLRRLTGLQITTKLRDLTDEQISRVAAAIKIIEGWRIGKETQIQTNVLSQQVPVQDSLNRYTAVKNDILYKSFEHTI